MEAKQYLVLKRYNYVVIPYGVSGFISTPTYYISKIQMTLEDALDFINSNDNCLLIKGEIIKTKTILDKEV